MRASSSTYRLLTVVVVSVMTWPVLLPVVHMACAMDTDVMAATCEHEATPAVSVDHDMHVRPLLEVDDVVDPDPQPLAMACCFVETSVLDRSAVPARIGDDSPGVALSSLVAAHTFSVPAPRSDDRPGALPLAPPTPPPSLAFLSAFLI